MALKLVVDNLDGVPEALKGEYELKDGKYTLKVEGLKDATSVENALRGEREAKARAERELAQLREKIGDLDPEKAREALKRIQELEDKKLLTEGKVEELIVQRTERMKLDYENKIQSLNKDRDTITGQLKNTNDKLATVLIDKAITDAGVKNGVKKTAIPDLVLRARSLFVIENGVPTPKKSDGTIQYGKDPNQPMSPEEWVNGLTTEAPHLFEPSGGGDATGTRGGSHPQIRNGAMVISREEAKDPAKYQAAKERAAKAGAELEIAAPSGGLPAMQ